MALRAELFLDDLPDALFSALLLSQLRWPRDLRILHASSVADAVRSLGIGDRLAPTKKESPCTREPLKGFWHKRFFDDRLMGIQRSSGAYLSEKEPSLTRC